MRVALLGGTGDLGAGLALRWADATDHELVIGSRDDARARDAAGEYEARLADHGVDRSLAGAGNREAAAGADVVVLSVPPVHLRSTVGAVRPVLAPGTVLVTPAVPMRRDDAGYHHDPPGGAASLAEFLARSAPDGTPVVGAYHALPAGALADLDADLGYDVPVVGDDADARATVAALTEAVPGLRALDAGGLGVAAAVEALTPLLLNLKRNADVGAVGPSFR